MTLVSRNALGLVLIQYRFRRRSQMVLSTITLLIAEFLRGQRIDERYSLKDCPSTSMSSHRLWSEKRRYVRYESYFACARSAVTSRMICVAEDVRQERVPLAKLLLRLLGQSLIDRRRILVTAGFSASENELIDHHLLLSRERHPHLQSKPTSPSTLYPGCGERHNTLRWNF
jgi:hypothetical protein